MVDGDARFSPMVSIAENTGADGHKGLSPVDASCDLDLSALLSWLDAPSDLFEILVALALNILFLALIALLFIT